MSFEKSIEGSNDLKYVVNVETSAYEEEAHVFFDDPNTGNKWDEKYRYTKFIYLRNTDLLSEFFDKSLKDEKQRLKDYYSNKKPDYLANKVELNYIKEFVGGQPKGILPYYVGLVDKEEITKQDFLDNYLQEQIEKRKNSILKKVEYSVDRTLEKYNKIKLTRQELIDNKLAEYDLDNLFIKIENEVRDIFNTYDVVDNDLILTLKEEFEVRQDNIKKFIEKYDTDIEDIKNNIETFNNCLTKHIPEIPSMKFIENKRVEFNKYKKLVKNPIIIDELYTLNNKNGKTYDRLKYGYTHIIKTSGNYALIVEFIKSYVGIDLYSDVAKETGVFEKLRATDQFLIDQNIRLYKGIDSYEQLSRITYDMETTDKQPAQATCKSCGKIYNLMSKTDIPQKCNNILEKKDDGSIVQCGHDNFEIKNVGQIYNISYKDSRSDKAIALSAQNLTKNEDGKIVVDENEEKELIRRFFTIIQRKKPSIISGYNSEFFDFPFVIYRADELGLRTQPVKCINSSDKPLDDNYREFNGYMKPYLNDKGEITHFISDNEYCNHRVEKKDLKNVDLIAKSVTRRCKCGTGVLSYNEETNSFSCNSCDISYKYEQFRPIIKEWCERLDNYILTSYSYLHPIHKNNYMTKLKLGGEVENYRQTNMYGITVIDDSHAVRGTKAINSNIKSWSLKYISDFKPLKAKEDRTHIEGSQIFEIYSKNEWYIVDKSNVYKRVPEDYEPEQYLELVNDKDSLKTISDYNDNFLGVNKNNEYVILDEDDEDSDTETLTKDELFIKIPNKDFYENNCGEFRLITGKQLIDNYAMDDVYETEKVGNHYQGEKFMSVKFFPMSFQTFATAGTASSLNIIFIGLRYEKGLCLPHRIPRISLVGGLSRAFIVGFIGDNADADGINKFDFKSLYPSLEKALSMLTKFIPFASEVDDMLSYGFDKRFYWKARKLVITTKRGELPINEAYDKFIKFLTEDGSKAYIEQIKQLMNDNKLDELKSEMLKYEKIADGRQQALKVKFINSIFGAIFSSVPLFGEMAIGNWTCASGRMFLRSSIYHSLQRNCIPTVTDTDGFNVIVPKTIKRDINLNKISEEIPFEELEYNGNKGVDAIISHYNDNHLPVTTDYMGLDLDGVDEKNYISRPKNYLNYNTPKVKEVGNSFKSSNIQTYIKNFLDKHIPILFASEDLMDFTREIYKERLRILEGKLTISEVAKKKRNKKTIDEYINRGTNKNGDQLPSEAHMELQIMNNIKPVMGEIVHFINVAPKKDIGDNKYFNTDKKVKQKVLQCQINNKKLFKFAHDTDTEDFVAEYNINAIDLFRPIIAIIRKIKSNVKKQIETDELEKQLNNELLIRYKSTKVFKLLPNVKNLNIIDKCEKLLEFFDGYDDKEKFEVNSRYFNEVKVLLCTNENCNAHKSSQGHVVGLDEELKLCGKKTGGVKCESDTFIEEEFTIKVKHFASVLIDNLEIEQNPNKVIDYNRLQADESFTNKMIPLLNAYPKKYRKDILPKIPNNLAQTQYKEFLTTKLNELENISDKITLNYNEYDTLTELFTLERKEIEFWRDMVNMNPKAIFPQVYIPQPMPDWDEYNEICDKFDTVLKYKGVDYRLTRDKMFTRENDLFLENKTYKMFRKIGDNFVCLDFNIKEYLEIE